MVSKPKRVSVCVFLLVSVLAFEAGAAPGSSSVSGRLYTSDTQEPIAEVAIMLCPEDGGSVVPAVKTDAGGRYHFDGLVPGLYLIKAMTCAFVRSPTENERHVRLNANEAATDVDLVLRAGCAVEGHVVDSSRNPVADAKVKTPDIIVATEVQTKADGSFRIRGYHPGAVARLDVLRSGFEPMSVKKIRIPAEGVSGLVIALAPAASISGNVVYPDGRPACSFRVFAVPEQAPPMAEPAPEGAVPAYEQLPPWECGGGPNQTDLYRIECLPPGKYRLFARQEFQQSKMSSGPLFAWRMDVAGKPTYESFAGTAPLAEVELALGQQVAGLQLVMERDSSFASIKGTVRDAQGRPVCDAGVSAMGGRAEAYTRTNAEGSYELYPLIGGGRYVICAYSKGCTPDMLRDIEAWSEHVDLTLTGTATIRGRVVCAGTDAPVYLFKLRAGLFMPQPEELAVDSSVSYTAMEGPEFELAGVSCEMKFLVIRASGLTPAVCNLQLKPDAVTDLHTIRLSEGATIQGVVRDGTGDPILGAKIYTRNLAVLGTDPFSDATPSIAVTGADGTFSLGNVPTSIALISAFHPDHWAKTAHLQLAEGHTTTVDIRLDSAATVEGVVTVVGKPVPEQGVALYILQPFGTTRGTKTDEKGMYRFRGVPPALIEIVCDVKAPDGAEPGVGHTLRQKTITKPGEVQQVDLATVETGPRDGH